MLLDINRYTLVMGKLRASIPSVDAALLRADEEGQGEYLLFSRESGSQELAVITVEERRIVMTVLR